MRSAAISDTTAATRSATPPPVDVDDDAALFALLSLALAGALVLHQLWWHGVELTTLRALVIYAAIAVAARPSSVPRLVVMLAAEVVATAVDLPYGGSHIVLLQVVSAFSLAQVAWLSARRRALPSPRAVFLALAPFLRTAIVVLYAAAALAKMNSGFLDPVTSCARSMSQQIAWFDPSLLGEWRVEPAIWGTVVAEVALPILLILRRTRVLGLLLGIAFHIVLGLAGNVPFSAVALAFYVAFVPLDTPGLVRIRWQRGRRPPSWRLPASLLALWLVLWEAQTRWPRGFHTTVTDVARVVVLVTGVVAGVVLVSARRRAPRSPSHQRPGLLLRSPLLLVGSLLLAGIAACPYLGLKTDNSFEMFSNLRTEPGAWNHELVPEWVRVFGAQDDAVRVVSSNDPQLVARTADGTRIVPFELDRYLRTHAGVTATVIADGDTSPHTVGPLPQGESLLERLASFRDVVPLDRARC